MWLVLVGFGLCSVSNFWCPKKPALLLLHDDAKHLYLNTSRKNIAIKKSLTLFTLFFIVWATFAVSLTICVAVAFSSSFKGFKATTSAGECCVRQKTELVFLAGFHLMLGPFYSEVTCLS